MVIFKFCAYYFILAATIAFLLGTATPLLRVFSKTNAMVRTTTIMNGKRKPNGAGHISHHQDSCNQPFH